MGQALMAPSWGPDGLGPNGPTWASDATLRKNSGQLTITYLLFDHANEKLPYVYIRRTNGPTAS